MIGAFYDTFEPGITRSLARRLDVVPTPKHGSWLNIAENELSALTAQCVKGRRFGAIEELREEVIAWTNQCNAKQKGVDWQLTINDSRIKLRSLYPNFKFLQGNRGFTRFNTLLCTNPLGLSANNLLNRLLD